MVCISFVCDVGISRLEVETDAPLMEGRRRLPLLSWIWPRMVLYSFLNIKALLLAEFGSVRVSQIPSSCNRVSDSLAKMGIRVGCCESLAGL